MVVFLKQAKKMNPNKTAKFYLHQHLSGFSDGRTMKNIHASELTKSQGFCPRAYALSDATDAKTKDEWLTTSERVTFQMGRDLERNVVLWFGEMGRAVCHWKCLGCGKPQSFQLQPSSCSSCHSKRFDPVEVRFKSAKNGASAGIDMLLAMGKPKLRVHEIKTMDKDEFKKLEAPLAEHRLRTNLYLRIIAESESEWAKDIDTSEASILYTSKGGYGCADPEPKGWGINEQYSPFKEYVVKRDDAETDDIAARAQVVSDFRSKKIGMPSGICPSAMSKRAALCPFKTKCFSGEFPPQHDWTTA